MSTVRNLGQAAGTTVVAVFGEPASGPTFVDVAPPDVPPPMECRSYRDPLPPGVDFDFGPRPPFWDRIEGRAALGHPPWEDYEPEASDVATWVRFEDPPIVGADDGGPGELDPLAVLTIADRMPRRWVSAWVAGPSGSSRRAQISLFISSSRHERNGSSPTTEHDGPTTDGLLRNPPCGRKMGLCLRTPLR